MCEFRMSVRSNARRDRRYDIATNYPYLQKYIDFPVKITHYAREFTVATVVRISEFFVNAHKRAVLSL